MGRRALTINLCFEASRGQAKCVATEQEQPLDVDVGTSPRHCQPRGDTQQTWTSQKSHLGSGGGQLVQNQAILKQNWPRNDFFSSCSKRSPLSFSQLCKSLQILKFLQLSQPSVNGHCSHCHPSSSLLAAASLQRFHILLTKTLELNLQISSQQNALKALQLISRGLQKSNSHQDVIFLQDDQAFWTCCS